MKNRFVRHCLCLALVALLSGACSWSSIVQAPKHESPYPGLCKRTLADSATTYDMTFALLDTVLAVTGGILLVLPDEREPQSTALPSGRAEDPKVANGISLTVLLGGLFGAALHGASAYYGYQEKERCQRSDDHDTGLKVLGFREAPGAMPASNPVDS